MSRIRQTLLIISLLLLVGAVQQTLYFFTQWHRLMQLNEEVQRLVQQMTTTIHDNAFPPQQQTALEQQHQQLRDQLPETIQTDQLEHALQRLAADSKLKILAMTTAIYGRPRYREARIDLTIEASASQRKQFIHAITSLPRTVIIKDAPNSGNKNAHYTLLAYALPSGMPPPVPIATCQPMPKGLVIPWFEEELSTLYIEYRRQCAHTEKLSKPYLETQRILALQSENERLQSVLKLIQQADKTG